MLLCSAADITRSLTFPAPVQQPVLAFNDPYGTVSKSPPSKTETKKRKDQTMSGRRLLLTAANIATLLMGCSVTSLAATTPHYLITNNDNSSANSATVYTISAGSLVQKAVVTTGGKGIDAIGTSAATKRVSVLRTSAQRCAFISDAGSNDVAGIAIDTLTSTGTFKGSSTDSGSFGVALANNRTYLYASFSGSKTIATFQIASGCKLTFVQDIPASGLSGGSIQDMAVTKSILVVSFGDGSIESFTTTGGVPVSNGDLQLSTGNKQNGSFPAGVDIDSSGHFAVFGGTASPEIVEVSDISSGKLAPTVVYSNLGSGNGSESVWFSPDDTLLYIGNFSSQQVTAAFFNKTSGTVSNGCLSSTLKGTADAAGLATAMTSGSGGTLYVAEPDTTIGILRVTVSGSTCSLIESPKSPAHDSNTLTLESIGVFPPRPF